MSNSDLFKRWWLALEEDRGGRSSLRRCPDPASVVMLPAFHRLYAAARHSGFHNTERIAVAAAALAHVRTDAGGQQGFARLLAPEFSEARFRRLMTIDGPSELQQALIRTIRLNHGVAPVESLGRDIQYWGDNVKQRWAFDYYQKELPS